MRIHVVPLRAIYCACGGVLRVLMPEAPYVVPCWLAEHYVRYGMARTLSSSF